MFENRLVAKGIVQQVVFYFYLPSPVSDQQLGEFTTKELNRIGPDVRHRFYIYDEQRNKVYTNCAIKYYQDIEDIKGWPLKGLPDKHEQRVRPNYLKEMSEEAEHHIDINHMADLEGRDD